MSRIPLDHKPTPPLRVAEIYSKRRYGAVLQPGQALLHNRKVLLAMIGYENRVARWNALDPTVKAVAVLAAAAEIGCGWCLDFGHRARSPRSMSSFYIKATRHTGGADAWNEILELAELIIAVAKTSDLWVKKSLMDGQHVRGQPVICDA